jgi:hypothetical protein
MQRDMEPLRARLDEYEKRLYEREERERRLRARIFQLEGALMKAGSPSRLRSQHDQDRSCRVGSHHDPRQRYHIQRRGRRGCASYKPMWLTARLGLTPQLRPRPIIGKTEQDVWRYSIVYLVKLSCALVEPYGRPRELNI